MDQQRQYFQSKLNHSARPANAMPLSGQALWYDEKRNVIYCFGGFRSFVNSLDQTPFESIWAFTPDGQSGSGTWKEVLSPTVTRAFPSDIVRPYYGGFCNDESFGYYVGGFVSEKSTRSVTNEIASRGLLTFHFDDLHISNTSNGNYARSLRRKQVFGSGKMVDIPNFGSGGIIVLLGEGNPSQVISFLNITIYDKNEHNRITA